MKELTRDELIVLLIEECGEVIQAATKCLRFGYDVDHGTGYGNNKKALSREVGDLIGVAETLPLDFIELGIQRQSKVRRAEAAKAKFGAGISASLLPIPPLGERCPTCNRSWELFPPTKINGEMRVRCIECKDVFDRPDLAKASCIARDACDVGVGTCDCDAALAEAQSK